MEFLELKEDKLKDLIVENEMVMVQYGATWCGTCRLMKPKFKKMAPKHEKVLFTYVDAEKLPESRSLAKVDNLPTFAIFKNGKLLNQKSGNKSEILEDLINEVTSN